MDGRAIYLNLRQLPLGLMSLFHAKELNDPLPALLKQKELKNESQRTE
jgi:hypothetical protein